MRDIQETVLFQNRWKAPPPVYSDFFLLKHGGRLLSYFEKGLFPVYPALEEISRYLKSFHRPLLMTGSGSAFFLVGKSEEEQIYIAEEIKKDRPLWFTAAAKTKADRNLS